MSRILNEQAGASVTPEMSRKLGELLNQTPDLWYRLRDEYDEWHREHYDPVV